MILYTVHDSDRFESAHYPLVARELSLLKEGTAHLPSHYKSEIILSYLKDHCIMNDWIIANPGLVALITSNHFQRSHIESLFESARNHNTFLHDFEVYVTDKITA
jgi:hypothetical protein